MAVGGQQVHPVRGSPSRVGLQSFEKLGKQSFQGLSYSFAFFVPTGKEGEFVYPGRGVGDGGDAGLLQVQPRLLEENVEADEKANPEEDITVGFVHVF